MAPFQPGWKLMKIKVIKYSLLASHVIYQPGFGTRLHGDGIPLGMVLQTHLIEGSPGYQRKI